MGRYPVWDLIHTWLNGTSWAGSVPEVKRTVEDLGYQVKVRPLTSEQRHVKAEYSYGISVNSNVLVCMYMLIA